MACTDEQTRAAIRHEAERAIAAATTSPVLRDLLERRGRYDERFRACCVAQGWTSIGIAEDHGGVGLGAEELCLIAEPSGAVACGAMFLEAGFIAAQAIQRHGEDALRALWLPRLADGSAIAALSYGLSDGEPVVLREGRLHGSLGAVPGGAVADLGLIVARGALLLVDLRQPAVTHEAIETFDNSRCVADLRFDDAGTTRLGGSAEADALLDLHAVLLAFQQIGGAGAMLTAMRDHALTRRAFGQPIGAFQSIKHRIAEAYVLIELARASAREAVTLVGAAGFSRAAAAARLLATEAYETAARDAIQIHGGIGVTWEADLHLHQRRARSLALELGPPMFWEDRLTALLAGEAA
jgi:acyl-CoA dehydrogenase